jgi:hypothetical protein
MSWDESDITLLKNLWGKQSASIIGDRIGKTKNAVIGKAHRLKLPPQASTPKVSKKMKNVKVYLTVKRSKCQWMDGDPVERRTNDEGKCLRPTIYRDNGTRSSYCLKHTQRAWRKVKPIKM